MPSINGPYTVHDVTVGSVRQIWLENKDHEEVFEMLNGKSEIILLDTLDQANALAAQLSADDTKYVSMGLRAVAGLYAQLDGSINFPAVQLLRQMSGLTGQNEALRLAAIDLLST